MYEYKSFQVSPVANDFDSTLNRLMRLYPEDEDWEVWEVIATLHYIRIILRRFAYENTPGYTGENIRTSVPKKFGWLHHLSFRRGSKKA